MAVIRQRTVVNTPGSLAGIKPKTFGRGRRCLCGTVISEFTQGDWCNLCCENKDRKVHFTEHPKEIVMEPEKMTVKQAADYLVLTGKGVKSLERAGMLKASDRGRGIFGSKYLADDVRALKVKLDLEADAVPKLAQGGASGGLTRVGEGTYVARGGALDDEKPSCDNDPGSCKNGDGCGQPDTCSERLEITSAEPGYPDPREYPASNDGAAAYERDVKAFEGETSTVLVDEPVQCCGQRPEGDSDCSNCPLPETVHGEGPSYAGGRDRLLPPVDEDENPHVEGERYLLDVAWGIIANANLEDWNNENGLDKTEWRVAAERWRDEYHAHLLREDEAEDAEAPAESDLVERAVLAAEKAAVGFQEQSDLTQHAIEVASRAVAHVVNLDPEAKAMDSIAKAMESLDGPARERVITWTDARFHDRAKPDPDRATGPFD